MAERVQLRREEMMPELELLEKLKIFEKPELRSIINNRTELEYKIQKRTKCKDDFLRYVQYEISILKLIRDRRKVRTCTKKGKKQDTDCEQAAENQVIARIARIFSQALLPFKEDVKLWLSYIKFCQHEPFLFPRVTQTVDRMLTLHSDKPSLFQLASSWEYGEYGSIEKARMFLQKGIRLHSDNSYLYSEAFKLELRNAAMLRKKLESTSEAANKAPAIQLSSLQKPNSDNKDANESDQHQTDHGPDHEKTDEHEEPEGSSGESDKVTEGRLAEVIYESACKKVHNVEFYITILNMATLYDFTQNLQSRIINDILNQFPNDELTWDAMARRELKGISYTNKSSENSNQSNNVQLPTRTAAVNTSVATKKDVITKKHIEYCCEVYETAVKQINTEKMWTLYIEALLELNQGSQSEILPRYKRNILLKVFQAAHSINLLSEKFYAPWVEMLKQMNSDNKITAILKTATERIPSVELYALRLCAHLNEGDTTEGQIVFEEAISKIGDIGPAIRLWKIMLQTYQLISLAQKEQIFKQGITRGTEISCALKPMYLEWIVLSNGISSARRTYDVISMQPPFSLELHTKMIELEKFQPEENVKQVRKCFELACDQFGKTNADIWIDYVKYEMNQGSAVNMASIQGRASKYLDPTQADIFISEYSLLKTSMSL